MKKQIIILGAGFGGVGVYRALRQRSSSSQESVTIIDRNNFFTFTPMLHEVATGSVERAHIVQPVREILANNVDHFLQGSVLHIDPQSRSIRVQREDDGVQTLTYDALVIALGARVEWYGVPGAAEHAFALKSLEDAVKLRNHIIAQFERASQTTDPTEQRKLLHFVVIGGGPTGVELAGQLADFVGKDLHTLYRSIPRDAVSLTLVHRDTRLLGQFRQSTSASALARLQGMRVRVILGCSAASVSASAVTLSTGEVLVSATPIWTSGVKSVMSTCIDASFLNKNGQVIVTPEMHLPEFPHTFVLGDAAALDGVRAPFAPQTAQSASAAATVVAANVRAVLFETNATQKPFAYRQRGYIMPIGDWYAVGEIGSYTGAGRCMWWLRRTIFVQQLSSWMNRFRVVIDWTFGIFVRRDTSEM